MRTTNFHLRIRGSLSSWCGGYSLLRACMLSTSALLVFAVTGVSSQVVPASASNSGEALRLYESGLALVRNGHIDEAISAFQKGLEIAPRDKILLDATGAAYSMRGDLERAQEYFIESLKEDPGFVPARQNLGITLFGLGRYSEAADQFKSLQAQVGQSHQVANLFLGMIAQKQSDCKAAAPLLEGVGAILYHYSEAVLSLASCDYQIGNPQRASQLLAVFDRTPGKSPSQYQQAADLYTRLGQKQRAISELSKARSGKDQTANSERKRAALLEKTGQLAEAQKVLEGLAASQPTEDVLLDLARVAKDRGALDVAMKSLQHAAEIEPDREDSYLEFSSICSDHGNDPLALKTAEIGLSHIPNSYRLTVQKGAVLEQMGRLNDAEGTLQKAMSMQKDNSIARLGLAVVQAHSGRAEEAEQTLTTAIRQFPDNYYMYYFRGRLLSQFAGADSSKPGLREAAKHSLEESIRLNPTYADSYYQLSELYLPAESNLSEQALQKCLRLNPNHLPAQYSLARLYLRTGRKEKGQALLASFKTQQRSEELQQEKQLRIDVEQK